jgi:acid phosphatase family membrane protein YuiD
MRIELSSYIISPILAWVLAQILKYLAQAYKAHSLKDISFLYKSGNMPSSHAALMLSLLTVIAVRDGTASALFAVVLVLSMIIIYDAINVRRAVGDQGPILLELAQKAGLKPKIHLAMGHRISEVTVGSLLGIAVAVLVLQFM